MQVILIQLQQFCSKWRIGLNATKTKLLLFQLEKPNGQQNTIPNIFLKNELVKYEESVKFLGVIFDKKLTFEEHILDVVRRAHKRMNLLKALKGRGWGASSETILHTYRTFIRPILEYSCILFAHASNNLLKKIQAVETTAIKLAFDLAPWTTNYWTYTKIDFTPILDRLKNLGIKFINQNRNEPLMKPLIDNARPSDLGKHSPIFKLLNW